MTAELPAPGRGELWFAVMPTDPEGKTSRPVAVVSMNARNKNPRANTVLVVPLSTSLPRLPTHIELPPGETGLERSILRCEDLTVMKKEWLRRPTTSLRPLSEARMRQVGMMVLLAMGISPPE